MTVTSGNERAGEARTALDWLRRHARRLGTDHTLAAALWETGFYEARMLAVFVEDPAAVTRAQMDRWCRAFDSWAICDTACFHLFDRTPHAFGKVALWAKRRPEYERRAAFALLASLALHRRDIEDEPFARCLPLVEAGAADGRNFVKKAVSWALRGVGRRSVALHARAVALARRLAASPEAAPRWVGTGTTPSRTSRLPSARCARTPVAATPAAATATSTP